MRACSADVRFVFGGRASISLINRSDEAELVGGRRRRRYGRGIPRRLSDDASYEIEQKKIKVKTKPQRSGGERGTNVAGRGRLFDHYNASPIFIYLFISRPRVVRQTIFFILPAPAVDSSRQSSPVPHTASATTADFVPGTSSVFIFYTKTTQSVNVKFTTRPATRTDGNCCETPKRLRYSRSTTARPNSRCYRPFKG